MAEYPEYTEGGHFARGVVDGPSEAEKNLSKMDKPPLLYLATPYNHQDPGVREARFNTINHVAADLMKKGWHVFSPISHTHPIAEAGELPLGWEYWEKYDRLMLSMCDKLIVVTQIGWRESVGVQGEIAIAKELGLPIEYIKCVTLEIWDWSPCCNVELDNDL